MSVIPTNSANSAKLVRHLDIAKAARALMVVVDDLIDVVDITAVWMPMDCLNSIAKILCDADSWDIKKFPAFVSEIRDYDHNVICTPGGVLVVPFENDSFSLCLHFNNGVVAPGVYQATYLEVVTIINKRHNSGWENKDEEDEGKGETTPEKVNTDPVMPDEEPEVFERSEDSPERKKKKKKKKAKVKIKIKVKIKKGKRK
jgi:hypothetical protein